jgi:hypothetical protein
MFQPRKFLPNTTETEISTEIAEVIRQAIIKVGHEQGKVVIVGQINIQLNMAQGCGAKVEVSNK